MSCVNIETTMIMEAPTDMILGDLDDTLFLKTGVYKTSSATKNLPPGISPYGVSVFHIRFDTENCKQEAYDMNGNILYRYCTGAVWRDWKTINNI